MEKETFQRIKTSSPRQGTFLGVMWILSFIGIANAVSNPLYSMLGLGIGIGSLISAVTMSYQFRWLSCQGKLTLGGQWLQVLMMMFYACILMAMGLYIYMRFVDNGRFGAMYSSILEIPEQKQMLESMLEGTGVAVDDFVSSVTTIKPIEFALNLTRSNLLASFLLSPIITLFARIHLNRKIEKID